MVVRQAHTRTPSEAVTRSLAVPAPPQPSRPHDIDIPLATSNNAVVSFRPADVWNLTLTVEHPANDLTHIGLHVATALATAGWSVHAITGTRLTPRDVAFADTGVQTPAGAARLISALVSEAVATRAGFVLGRGLDGGAGGAPGGLWCAAWNQARGGGDGLISGGES